MQNPRRAFTLIELLVVIAIIGLLSSVVLASLNAARERARDASRAASLREVVKALELRYYDAGNYPTSAVTGHAACGGNTYCLAPIVSTYLVPTYISSVPADPQYENTTSNYRYCGSATNYTIIAYKETIGAWCHAVSPNYHTGCGAVGSKWYQYPEC